MSFLIGIIVGILTLPLKLIILYTSILTYGMFAYVIGSIPSGLILTKIFLKKDIRNEGSGNIGTTNVLRSGGKKLAAATLILDMLKASVPVFIFSIHEGVQFAVIIGLFAILGHCFPVWLKFKGGKGVATTFGALFAAVPYAGLAAAAAWLTTAFLFRISSLAALVAVAIAPIVTFFVYGLVPAAICALITLLVWVRHTENIRRIMANEESRIGSKDTPQKQRRIFILVFALIIASSFISIAAYYIASQYEIWGCHGGFTGEQHCHFICKPGNSHCGNIFGPDDHIH